MNKKNGAPLSRGAQSGDAAERNQKAANVKSTEEKSFFSHFSACSQNTLLLLKFLSLLFLGLCPQIPCQELPLIPKSSCGRVRGKDTFPTGPGQPWRVWRSSEPSHFRVPGTFWLGRARKGDWLGKGSPGVPSSGLLLPFFLKF